MGEEQVSGRVSENTLNYAAFIIQKFRNHKR